MSRRRYLSTDISADARVKQLMIRGGYFAALLFTWMIPHAGDDRSITADLDELQMLVVPGAPVTSDEMSAAVELMLELGLVVKRTNASGEERLFFKRRSFYKIQAYIPVDRRNEDEESAQNGANQRESALAREAASLKLNSPSGLTLVEVGVNSVAPDGATPTRAPAREENSTDPEEPKCTECGGGIGLIAEEPEFAGLCPFCAIQKRREALRAAPGPAPPATLTPSESSCVVPAGG